MRMEQLARYDLPPEIIALWKERQGPDLLPLQEAAARQFDLFGPGNLLIQAPTSSGKTFIGEMAAVRTALRRKKVVYLVPLKALAEEKFLDFRAKYQPYGIRVIVSSRDHREFDLDLEHGEFSIAVVVYEKLAQLLVRRPERIEEIELVIADELEILSDPERGAPAELLLTRIVRSSSRLIGLSAVIGKAEQLAQWMRARLLHSEHRPVELRYGVLHDGVFRYKTYNGHGEDHEPMAPIQSGSAWELLAENVRALADRGETSLVFVKAKHESRIAAELLAARLDAPPAAGAIAALRALEPTRSRDALLHTLETAVAFHNADLAPAERRIVEHHFRHGDVRVLVSTSTLAAGMNLPARNVFITDEKWRYDPRFDMPWKAPITRAEYENMGGRAGRYGAGQPFGRSILLALTPFDHEALWRRYVDGQREPIQPRLAHGPLEDHVLQLVASRCCRNAHELLDFLETTLSGQWVWPESRPLHELEQQIRAALHRAADAGMITAHPEGPLEATPLGHAVAAKGLSVASARELEHWIAESERRDWPPIDLILAAAMTPDGRIPNLILTAREFDHADYPARLKRLARDEDPRPNVPLNRVRAADSVPFFDDVRAVKVALVLHDWIEQAPLAGIEERYETMSGQVLAAAEQIAWIIDATAAVASALAAEAPFIERLRALAERVQRGLRAEGLPLARLRDIALSRRAVTALVEHGLTAPEDLAQTPLELLEQWMDPQQARALRSWAERNAPGPQQPPRSAPTPAPVLIVDDRQPDRITLDGAPVKLQEKQFRLIRLLARHPAQCVPYDRIYAELWGDAIVEDGQIAYQKAQLLKRIAAAAPRRKHLVKTVPKRGFKLDLPPESVLLAPAVDAA